MSKFADSEVTAFLLNSGYPIKQIVRIAKTLKQVKQEIDDERDADYDMGRGPMPEGYMKRRLK